MADVGSMIHEIGHTLGMAHEHQRPDAGAEFHGKGPFLKFEAGVNRFVPIEKNYMGSADDGPGDPQVGYAPYDYESLMHSTYGISAIDDDPAKNQLLTNRDHLSQGDIAQLWDAYRCRLKSGSSTETTTSTFENSWTLISSTSACEENTEGIVRTWGNYGFSTLGYCQTQCELTAGCVAVDFYTESAWCNTFDVACSTPRTTKDGASSYRLIPRTTTSPSTSTTTTSLATTSASKPSCQECLGLHAQACIDPAGMCFPAVQTVCDSMGGIWCTPTSSTTQEPTTSTLTTTSAESTTSSMVGDFSAVDGGSNRACRGSESGDNSESYYKLFPYLPSLEACKDLCRASDPRCVGIEFNMDSGRCEVWTRIGGIGATSGVQGYQCLRFSGMSATTSPITDDFVVVDGGANRACRGAHAGDNSMSYYDLFSGTSSLAACKDLCRAFAACVGIEFNRGSGRCEVWTRLGGIGASTGVEGYQCLRYESDSY